MTLFFDELNAFLEGFRTGENDRSGEETASEGNYPLSEETLDAEDIIDELLDLYLLAYEAGSKQAAEDLGITPEEPSGEDLTEVINRKIDGKTFEDRVRAYASGDMGNTTGTPKEAIARVAETDAMRVFNEAGMKTAINGGATKKTWQTMMDNRVRDTHSYLEGMSVDIDAEFYTYDGDHAPAPGQFTKPENTIGCRCILKFS